MEVHLLSIFLLPTMHTVTLHSAVFLLKLILFESPGFILCVFIIHAFQLLWRVYALPHYCSVYLLLLCFICLFVCFVFFGGAGLELGCIPCTCVRVWTDRTLILKTDTETEGLACSYMLVVQPGLLSWIVWYFDKVALMEKSTSEMARDKLQCIHQH